MALTETRRTGDFLLSEASGTRSREEVTIDLSAGAMIPGTVVSKLNVSGKYVAYDDVGTDGSEVAAGILYAAVEDKAVDQKGVVLVRDCEVTGIRLTGSNANAVVDLRALGVIVR